jgi:hypothetical protein
MTDINPLNRHDPTLNQRTPYTQPSLGDKPVVLLPTKTHALPTTVTKSMSQRSGNPPPLKNRCDVPTDEKRLPQMPNVLDRNRF